MTAALCRYCGQRVRVIHEGDAIAADCELVAIYDEHDPCHGSYAPVVPPAEVAPEEDAPKVPRRVARAKRRQEAAERIRAIEPRHVLAAVGDGPVRGSDVARALRITEPAARGLLLALVDAGALYRHRSTSQVKGGVLYMSASLPRCPSPGPAALHAWPHLCRGAHTRDELAELVGVTGRSMARCLTRLRMVGGVVETDGRWKAEVSDER